MNYPNPHAPSCPWYDITVTQGAPNIKWCEETLCQWISEPANTWSNLGYLFVGVLLTFIAFKHKHSFNLKQFGPIIFFMGAMSLFYHLSNFYGSQILDFIGMFFFVGWAIGMNFIRLGKLKEKNLIYFNLIFGIFFTLVMHLMYVTGIRFQSLILLSGITIIVTELLAAGKPKVDYKWFIASVVSVIIAFGFSLSDGKRIWCTPENHGWFSQGHAVWHWIASFTMFAIYKHYSQTALNPHKNT
jgi:hypothetical protein